MTEDKTAKTRRTVYMHDTLWQRATRHAAENQLRTGERDSVSQIVERALRAYLERR